MVCLARRAGALVAWLDWRGRAVGLANLRCAYGERYTERERRQILTRSYQNFALTMSSLFWARRLTAQNFSRWIRLKGFDELPALLPADRQGVIFMCAHQGNWEWASIAAGFAGLQGTVLAGRFKNTSLVETFSAARQRSGHQIIAQEQSMLRLFKRLKRGENVGLLIDVCNVRERGATVVNAWGLKLALPILPATLALRTGAAIVPLITVPRKDGTCEVIAHPPMEIPATASAHEIAQRCWDVFEREINARPEFWIWSYKHFRNLPYSTTREYPFYANSSMAFEKLQRTVELDAQERRQVASVMENGRFGSE